MADPHLHFWPETGLTYAYATHDFSPTNKGFKMTDWWVWSSADLVEWSLVDVLYPNATPAPPADYANCWATDGAHRKNPTTGAWEYFFYMSIGTCQVAVMKSVTTPHGPWANVLGTPLLNATFGDSLNPKACFRDPGVFEDDDGAHYIIAGVFDYYIARLGEDLVSLAEPPRLVGVVNPTGPYGAKTDDKPFIHKYGGVYYLSWGCFYGTATSVYGPYTYVGSAIATAALAPAFQMNDTAGPWYGRQDYADRHGSFWSNGAQQWFYASNDRTHSTDVEHRSVYRDTVVGYVHYYMNGTIAPVVIDATGVGTYDARTGAIPAENFMRAAGARKAHLPSEGDALVVVFDDSRGAVVEYPHVRGAAGARIVLRAANAGERPARIVAQRGVGGAVFATCNVPAAGALGSVACKGALGTEDGDVAVVLSVVDGDAGAVMVDAFEFL